MDERVRIHRFANRDLAAEALAESLGATLRAALAERELASLVVSGGTTPGPMMRCLSLADIEWSRVAITLTDERWVPATDPASNEALVRRELMRGPAASARMVGLYSGDASPRDGCRNVESALRAMPRPFDASVLGMGSDGHVASLFPGEPDLHWALESSGLCAPMTSADLAQERITLTPRALLDTRRLILLFFGAEKMAVFESAQNPGDEREFPVRVLLNNERAPLEVYWAP